MLTKIFFFGSGTWAKNYINLIKKEFKKKILIICIISENLSHTSKEFAVEKNIEDALLKYQIPDGFIVCTSPYKNPDILSKIINYNKPIIIEKPICLDYDLEKMQNILINSSNKNILVNHFHFYDKYFYDFINKIDKKSKSEIKIFDGNSGPIRDISPLIDWGVHAFGIVNFLLSFDDMHIKKTRVLNRLNSMQLNYYFLITNSSESLIFKIIIGNNFKSKKRYLKIKEKNKIYHYFVNRGNPNEKSTMEKLMNIFYYKMIGKKDLSMIDTLELAINSIKMLKKLQLFMAK